MADDGFFFNEVAIFKVANFFSRSNYRHAVSVGMFQRDDGRTKATGYPVALVLQFVANLQ